MRLKLPIFQWSKKLQHKNLTAVQVGCLRSCCPTKQCTLVEHYNVATLPHLNSQRAAEGCFSRCMQCACRWVSHQQCYLQVHGNLVKTPGNLPVYPPEDASRVEVFLHLQTHFDKRRIKLRRDSHEEDVQGLKPKLTSGPLEDQLQRAIFKAACGLSSKNEEFQKIGRNVIDSIDVLEG